MTSLDEAPSCDMAREEVAPLSDGDVREFPPEEVLKFSRLGIHGRSLAAQRYWSSAARRFWRVRCNDGLGVTARESAVHPPEREGKETNSSVARRPERCAAA